MEVEERLVPVAQLRPGMFVSRLDRDWLGTPFPIQGFHVLDSDDVAHVATFCTHVYIDVLAPPPTRPRHRLLTLDGALVGGVPLRRTLPYQTRADVRTEAVQAALVQGRVLALATEIEQDLKSGRPVSAERVQACVEPLVASVLRNPDALLWLLGLLRRDSYAHSHSLHCSALAAAIGRHLAMPRDVLLDLATGGFLLDVGMASVPASILAQDGPLDEAGWAAVRGHVEAGLEVLDQAGIASMTVREMLSGHHERHDGSGYPAGLASEAIPLSARIAGVIDSYDAMINDRPQRPAQAPHAALQLLYRDRGRRYQEEVIEQFMQCLGVYPTGSLVELSNGEVAVVMAQNLVRRLRPRVMIVLDSDKQPYSKYRDIDLMKVDEDDNGRPAVIIVAVLAPGAYGLDAEELFLD